jgi:hypothetical protein
MGFIGRNDKKKFSKSLRSTKYCNEGADCFRDR